MTGRSSTNELLCKVSSVASAATERILPPQLLSYVDRTLLDLACSARSMHDVAESLQVDVPAVDAWRNAGVPSDFRGRLATLAFTPERVFRAAA